jgi:hypothetical protein
VPRTNRANRIGGFEPVLEANNGIVPIMSGGLAKAPATRTMSRSGPRGTDGWRYES